MFKNALHINNINQCNSVIIKQKNKPEDFRFYFFIVNLLQLPTVLAYIPANFQNS
jgi:hypothetical protein